jgi:hypothetical protein
MPQTREKSSSSFGIHIVIVNPLVHSVRVRTVDFALSPIGIVDGGIVPSSIRQTQGGQVEDVLGRIYNVRDTCRDPGLMTVRGLGDALDVTIEPLGFDECDRILSALE